LCCSLLCDDFTRVKLDQHRSVGFDLLDGDGEAEVVEEEELEFEVVKFGKWKAADLETC
jgi:hypothetical protein